MNMPATANLGERTGLSMDPAALKLLLASPLYIEVLHAPSPALAASSICGCRHVDRPSVRADCAEPLRHGQRRAPALPRGRHWLADHSAARIRRDESHVAAPDPKARGEPYGHSAGPAWLWGIGGPGLGLQQDYDGPRHPRSGSDARLDIGPNRRA